jgi:glycogen synthase
VRILVITNLFPPHHAGTYDFRCETVVARLRGFGHEVRVLTSNHGLRAEQRGIDVERRLHLNGVFGHERVTHVMDLKEIEFHNHRMVVEAVREFRPDLVYVWSLRGVSKCVLFTLERLGVARAFDIGDRWLADELCDDPWLDFWNREALPFKDRALRASLELSGQRDKWDEQAPTRPAREIKRLPFLFGNAGAPEVNSVTVFPFEHVQFVSRALKQATADAGFAVAHGEVIPPAVDIALCQSKPRRPSDKAHRLLVYGPLRQGSGTMTALRAMQELRTANPGTTLTVAGQGDSEYVSKLRSFVVQHDLPAQFELIGDTVTELPTVLAQHDVLLHVVESDELFTMAPMQAMASGMPAVVTPYGTVGEFLRHGENCIHFAPGDAADLAARVRELQSRPDLRAYLADRAQKEVAAEFEELRIMERIEQLLQRAAGRQ